MNKIVLLFLIFITLKLQAQPGGGGGLIIYNMYDENLKKISFDNNTIKIELLELDSVMTILNKHRIDNKGELYLPPPLSGYRLNTKTSGILIKYQNKEYRIDFENICRKNGGGFRERIDSLVLFKPYILSKRNYSYPLLKGNDLENYHLMYNLSEKYLRNGITPHTYNKLSALDLIFDSKDFAYNRKSKSWMEAFKNLYKRYRDNSDLYKRYGERHTIQKEKALKILLDVLAELDGIIKKDGINDAFVVFKMELLYVIKSYAEIINLYEQHPFEYDNQLIYLNNLLIDCYIKCKDYNKAIRICEITARNQLNGNKGDYYIYIYYKLFLEIYYQNKNREEEIQHILDNEEYSQYYTSAFRKLKILQSYCIYKFENKIKGIEQMNIYDKEYIPNLILKEIYPSVKVTEETYLDF